MMRGVPLIAVRLAALSAWIVVGFGCAQAVAETVRLGPGDLVTYTDAVGGLWCAHVGDVIENGVGGVPWAWVTIDADTRRVARLPIALLNAGCAL